MDLEKLGLAVLTGLLTAELSGQAKRLSAWILKRSILQLRDEEKAFYEEAWSSHLDDCPGPISKLRHALGCWLIAGTWRMDMTTTEYCAVSAIEIVGRLAATHAYYSFAKARLLTHASKRLPLSEKSRQKVYYAGKRLNEVTTIQQQAARLFIMYASILKRPALTKSLFLKDWMSMLGIGGGLTLMAICVDRYQDYCCFRHIFGIKVKNISIKYNKNTIETIEMGKKIMEATSKLHRLMEQAKTNPPQPES